jgi:signal transduction histidine kinase
MNSIERSAADSGATSPGSPGWEDRLAIAIINRLPENQLSRGLRSPHFWMIAALMAFLTLIYYSGQTPLAQMGGFFSEEFPRDLHRTLFLIPVAHAAVTFRMRGALVTSAVFLCIILPRALLESVYPGALLRALLFVMLAALVSFLTALLVDRVEKEEEARTELSAAHRELSAYVRQIKEGQEQIIRAEKMTSLGQMAASMAHEINNPLSGVLMYTKLLSKKLTGGVLDRDEALDFLAKMDAQLVRSSKIVRNLLDFARQTEPMLRLVDMNQVLEQVLSLVGHQAQLQNVEVVKEFSPSLPKVMADFDQLQQVFTNLTLNAIQAMADGGKLTLRTSAEDGQVKVDVEDTGCGIPKEHLNKLGTPFFTTKEKGKGVGLGVAVVYGIVERHKGKVTVESEVGKGTRFTVQLGVHDDEKGQDTRS